MTEDQIRTLIEAATWAPNHRLTQPWRFVVLRGEARERLGREWAAVVPARTDPDPIVAVEDFAAVAAAAVQNLLLAAEALDLGAMWRTGDMVYDPAIKEHLGLEPTDRIVASVYLGRPEMKAPPVSPERSNEIYGVVLPAMPVQATRSEAHTSSAPNLMVNELADSVAHSVHPISQVVQAFRLKRWAQHCAHA